MAGWRPILDGARALHARAIVDATIARWTAPAERGGLDGAAGRALVLAYAGRDSDDELDAAIATVPALGPGLHHGLAGVAFVLAHLGQDVGDSVDAGLTGALAHLPYDLVGGAVGIGVYALERGSPLLGSVIAAIDAAAVTAPVGRRVDTPSHWLGPDLLARYPDGACDLGVAHGQAAAIALARAAGATALHDDLLAHLWFAADDDGTSTFPAVAGERGPRRSAWCYGDLGIGAVLANEPRMLAVVRRAAEHVRADDEPTLCHGALGVAHLLNRVAHRVDDTTLHAAALAWYERALAMPPVIGGGLLQGELGAALAWLAACERDEPNWDRVLGLVTR